MQQRLGLSRGLVILDIIQGCSGFVYGLYVAALLIQAGRCRHVLLCNGDVAGPLSADKTLLDPNNGLFGDGGAATIVSRGDGAATFNITSIGEKHAALVNPSTGYRRHGRMSPGESVTADATYIDGLEIMNFSFSDVPENINGLLAWLNLDRGEVGRYISHQANKTILDSLADKLGVPREKLPFLAAGRGNASSASIPLGLSDFYHDADRAMLRKVVLCGFGVGLSVATAFVDISQTQILKTIEV